MYIAWFDQITKALITLEIQLFILSVYTLNISYYLFMFSRVLLAGESQVTSNWAHLSVRLLSERRGS